MRSAAAASGRRSVSPGRDAHRELLGEIRRAQAADPFAPVTVLVPSQRSALSLRRALASMNAEHDRPGLVNVRFELPQRLAELLAGALIPAKPRSNEAVLREAVRAALVHDPGLFGPAAAHPATVARVARAYREVRALDPGGIDALAASGRRGAALARLCRNVTAAHSGWYDEADLVRAAASAVARGAEPVDELGKVIFFAPRRHDHATAVLLEAFGTAAVVIEPAEPPPAELASGTALVSVPDPDEEARNAAREAVALAEAGIALHRVAVAYPTPRYAALLHQHFRAAGLPFHGPPARTLAQTPAGALLLGLLDVTATDLSRDAVAQWLAAAPIIDPASGRRVPASAWDLESRRAGVIRGSQQWQARLSRLAAELEAGGDELAERRRQVGELSRFVAELAATVAGATAQPWSSWARWAGGALERFLGDPPPATWPEEHLEAYHQVRAVVRQLADLDGIAPTPDLDTFRALLETQLTAPAGREGTFGDGVLIAPLDAIAGLSIDALIIVGAVEGALPRQPSPDALLGDDDRARAGLPARSGTISEQRRDFLIALATAEVQRTVLFPRADLRGRAVHTPSRWVLELAQNLTGRSATPGDLPRLAATSASVRHVASFAGGVAGAVTYAASAERRMAHLWSAWRHGDLATDPALAADPVLARSFAAAAARTAGGFSPYDGDVSGVAFDFLDDERPLSPTSLQTYARCPRQYLFGRVLGLAATERPEEIAELSALDRGSLVHRILERWVAERIAAAGWSSTPARLLDIADELFADIEARGLTGRTLPWRHTRAVLRRDLEQIAAIDLAGGVPVGDEPLAVELPFGRDGEPPVVIDLPDQGPVAFAGSVDRVGRTAGGTLVVADYKTGSARSYLGLEESTVDRGRFLQLPLYALAARQRFGDPTTPVTASYWFVTERERFRHIGYEVTSQRLDTFIGVLEVLVSGIRSGHFPARPGPIDGLTGKGEHCRHCDFDSVCPAGRNEQWQRTSTAPELARFVALVDGAAPAGEHEGGSR